MKKHKKIILLLALLFLFPVSSAMARTYCDCGNVTRIPKKIPELTSYIMTIVQIAVPVILVIIGSIDLIKGITSQKDDEIKKNQKIFIKRLIVAVLIFFIIVIVKFIISLVADSSSGNISSCIDCFLNNSCK